MKIKTIKFKLKKLVLVVGWNGRTCRGGMNGKGSGHSMGRFDSIRLFNGAWSRGEFVIGKIISFNYILITQYEPLICCLRTSAILSIPIDLMSLPCHYTITPVCIWEGISQINELLGIIFQLFFRIHIRISFRINWNVQWDWNWDLRSTYKRWQCVSERLKFTPVFYYSNYEQWDKILMTKFPTKDILMFPF